MPEDTVVMPAFRIPRRLWKSLEQIKRRKMFSGRAELVRDALREYVLLHEKASEFRISEAAVILKEGHAEDLRREQELIEWIRKIRA